MELFHPTSPKFNSSTLKNGGKGRRGKASLLGFFSITFQGRFLLNFRGVLCAHLVPGQFLANFQPSGYLGLGMDEGKAEKTPALLGKVFFFSTKQDWILWLILWLWLMLCLMLY